MASDFNSFLERREQRLALVRQLYDLLEQAQQRIVHSDLKALEANTKEQQSICHALGQLNERSVLAPPGATLTGLVGSGLSQSECPASQAEERWAQLGKELDHIEAQVRQLGRVHATLLRKAHYTVNIFARLLSSSATYVPPQSQAPTCGTRPER